MPNRRLAINPRTGQGDGHADDKSGQDQQERLAQNHTDHIAAAGADRHADADFASPDFSRVSRCAELG